MVDNSRPKLVGSYIRQRREALGLSQRALGLMFSPPVTTQFISNVERGVTPLPPTHVPTLMKALSVGESELMSLLQKEYSAKLSGRLGHQENVADGTHALPLTLALAKEDHEAFKRIYAAYQQADLKTKQAFATACASILNIPKTVSSTEKPE